VLGVAAFIPHVRALVKEEFCAQPARDTPFALFQHHFGKNMLQELLSAKG
jgi:hypothetical protein